MTNIAAPFGFRALRHTTSASETKHTPYTIASGYATSIFKGDVVKSDGAGGIALATPGDAVLGVFVGCSWTPAYNDGSVPFRNWYSASLPVASGTTAEALVADDPLQTFEVQCSTSASLAQQGLFVDIVAGTGNTVTGISGMSVGTPGGGAVTFQIFKVRTTPVLQNSGYSGPAGTIYGLAPAVAGANAILEVRPVKHVYLGSAAGIAV